MEQVNLVPMDEENKELEKKPESKFMTFWKEYYIYLFAVGIPTLIMMAVWIHAKIGPGKQSLIIVDGLHQYMPFFSDYYEKLKGGRTLFYSFEEGMGTNFLALWSYYLSSPLNLLILLFPKTQLNIAVSMIATMKIIFSSWSFTYAALHRNRVKYKHPGVIPLAVAYSMNNFIIGYYWNVMWMDCIMIFPLIILGFDYLVEKKDPRLYIFTLFYALFCNYYIGFMICVFLVLWALLYRYDDMKQLGRTAWTFAISSILAGGMAAITLVPAYKGIMQTSSAKRVLPGWDQYGSYIDLLQAHFVGVEPINTQTFDGGVNIYCGVFIFFFLFIYLMSNEFKVLDKLRYGIMLVLLFVSFNTEILNYIWHGFHNQYGIPNRFAFIYIFVLLWIAYEVMLRYRRINEIIIVIAGMLSLGLVLLCYMKVTNRMDQKVYIIVAALFLLYAVFSLLYAYMPKKGKLWRVVLAGVMCIELIASALWGWNQNGTIDLQYYFHDTEDIATIMDQLYEEDSDFYRMELGKARMLDEPTWHNMRCMTLFGSTAIGDMVTAVGRMGFYTGANEYIYRGATPLTNSIFGIKYVLYREGDFNNNTLNYKNTYEGIMIYENPEALPIGFAVNEDLLDAELMGTYFDVQNTYAWAATGIEQPLFVKPALTMSAGGVGCDVVMEDNIIRYSNRTSDDGTVQASFEIPENMDLYMDVSGGNVKQVKLIIDGQQVACDRYQGQAFHLGAFTQGQQIGLEFIFNDGAQSGSITLHSMAFQQAVWNQVYDRLQEHVMQVDSYKDNYFEGSITTEENQAIFFSIPNEDGWKLYIDGEEVEKEEVYGAFMAVRVPAGQHTVTLRFVSEGFYQGLILSLIACALAAGFIYLMMWLNRRFPDGILPKRVEETPENDVLNVE